MRSRAVPLQDQPHGARPGGIQGPDVADLLTLYGITDEQMRVRMWHCRASERSGLVVQVR